MASNDSLVPTERRLEELLTIKGLSQDLKEREEQVRGMSFILDESFIRVLSPVEQTAYRNGDWTDGMVEKFDEFAIEKAGIFGPPILLCPSVLDRYLTWPHLADAEQGIDRLKRFQANILRRVRIALGKEKGSVDPRIREFKEETVRELRTLLNSYRNRPDQQSRWKLSQWLRSKIQESPLAYPCLATPQNQVSLMQYLNVLPEIDQARARLLVNGRITPSGLFKGWYAWSEGISENTVAIRISEFGKKKL